MLTGQITLQISTGDFFPSKYSWPVVEEAILMGTVRVKSDPSSQGDKVKEYLEMHLYQPCGPDL